MTTPPPEHDLLRSFLVDAGDAALARFRTITGSRKADDTLVTEADHAAERVLVAALAAAFPQHALVGEEGARRGGDGPTWYIDPIDGTQAYVEGLAHWGPTVGLMEGGRPLLGATLFPRMQEYWFAAAGQGAWRDGSPLAPLQPPSSPHRAVVYLPSRFHCWFSLDHPGKARSLGSTTAHLCLVAGGAASATFIPAGWSLWDVVGGLCLLKEVGAVARTLSGEPLDLQRDLSAPFIAGESQVVSRLLDGIRFRPPRNSGRADV